jgi:small subunit ribosomal protein S14
MAKKSMIARENRRVKLSDRSKAKRRELASITTSLTSSYDEKLAAIMQLNKRPRDESPCRVKKRCRQCGRPRAVYRRFGLCRICLRQATMRGDVPGLTKESW